MRLLFFSNVFPNPLQPGKGVFNLNMVRALAERGHELETVSPIAWTEWLQAPRERRRALRTQRGEWAGVTASYPIYFYTPGVLRTSYGRFMWRGVRSAVRTAIERLRPEAIVAYWSHPDGECAVRAARLAQIPAVVMSGGSDVLLLASSPARRRSIERVLGDADAIVTVNEDIRRRLIDRGFRENKISVVRRGVDVERFHAGERKLARQRLAIADDRPLLLWVGRVEPVKGLSVLLEALEQLKRQGLVFRMLLIGSGEQASALQADARRRGLDDCVQWVGAVPHPELADYYRAADVTVLPSLSEGVPNVLLESIACGTPFVASNVGGVSEIATHGVDRLVPPGDSRALAAAIREQLVAPRVDADCRSFLPDGWPQAADRLLEVIRPLVSTTPRCESIGEWLKPATV